MKAYELRLGNLVNNYYKGHIKVNLSDINNIYSFDIKEHQQIYEPIQLTEEILLKCGFIDSYAGYYSKYGIINNEFKTPYNIDIYLINHKEYDFETVDDLPMLSVHQLQNYFYARTGEELSVSKI